MEKNNQNPCPELAEGYVIGVDGGGTKTVAALADLNGKILRIGKSGPSNPRNVGAEKAAGNLTQAIRKALKGKGKILLTFIGLAAVEEEPGFKKEIKKLLLKQKEISQILKGKVKIGSDQITAFRSGTDKKEGVLLIAGTGCVAHGWRGKKEAKTSGWGWLADKGSAFWAGQKAFQTIFQELDGRGPKTLITKLVFQQFRVKDKEELLFKIYSQNPTDIIPYLAMLINKAAKKRDKVAKKIMSEAGKELALAANTVIRKLNFQKTEFPLILVGSLFKSKIILNTVKKEIKKIAPQAEFIQPKQEPVVGAVKLAIEQISK